MFCNKGNSGTSSQRFPVLLAALTELKQQINTHTAEGHIKSSCSFQYPVLSQWLLLFSTLSQGHSWRLNSRQSHLCHCGPAVPGQQSCAWTLPLCTASTDTLAHLVAVPPKPWGIHCHNSHFSGETFTPAHHTPLTF